MDSTVHSQTPGSDQRLESVPTAVTRQKVYIIPRQKVFRNFFNAVQLYHNLEKKLKEEMLPVKFTELIYLLLNSPHRDVVLSFLSEATGNMPEKR